MGTWKASEIPAQFWDDFTALIWSLDAGIMFCTWPSCSQFPRGAIHRHLGGGNGVDCGHESLNNVKVVVGDVGPGDRAVGAPGSKC